MTRQGCHHWENHRTEVFVGRETTLEIMLKVHMIYQNYPKLLNVTVVMTVIFMFRWNTPRNADRPRDLRSPGLPLMTPGMIFERCRGDMGRFLGATKMSTAHVNSYMNNSYIKLTSFFCLKLGRTSVLRFLRILVLSMAGIQPIQGTWWAWPGMP